MARPSVIAIPHGLGVEEARRRLSARVDGALQHCQERGFEVEVGEWRENALPFTATAMGSRFAGEVRVGEAEVRLEMSLPWLLSVFMPVLEPVARSYGARLLAGDPDPA